MADTNSSTSGTNETNKLSPSSIGSSLRNTKCRQIRLKEWIWVTLRKLLASEATKVSTGGYSYFTRRRDERLFLNKGKDLFTETEQPEKLQERSDDFKAKMERGLACSRLSIDL